MRISIFGLGYVGAVSAGCLASEGHTVIGVDPNPVKVKLINDGMAPVIEKDLADMIARAVGSGALRATDDVRDAVLNSELTLICVGTPSLANGDLDLSSVRKVCDQIATVLHEKTDFHVVVMRSTVLPGTMQQVVLPLLESGSGKTAGRDFGVCHHPEFLREGSAVQDYRQPPKTVIGELEPRSGQRLLALYPELTAPLIRTDIATSEMLKYADNAWHALKVSFANEMGNLCKVNGLDGHRVMEAFCQDYKLNLSPYYLKPGFAFGGSCLPKDLRALLYRAKTTDLELPLLRAVLASNQLQLERGIRMVLDKGNRKIGVLGFAFKAGTDDLRESPMVELIESLIGKGYELKLYDGNVNLAALTGANQDYILNRIPHIARLMVSSVAEVCEFAETLVIGNAAEEFRQVTAALKPHQVVVDLVRTVPRISDGCYEGICW